MQAKSVKELSTDDQNNENMTEKSMVVDSLSSKTTVITDVTCQKSKSKLSTVESVESVASTSGHSHSPIFNELEDFLDDDISDRSIKNKDAPVWKRCIENAAKSKLI